MFDSMAALTGATSSVQGSTGASTHARRQDGDNTISFADFMSNAGALTTPATPAEKQAQAIQSQLARYCGDATGLFSAFHPSVYEQMAEDPAYATEMHRLVDEWAGSEMFHNAQAGYCQSQLLVGEGGYYTLSSTAAGAFSSRQNVLDMVVSSDALQQPDTIAGFLRQFDTLPIETGNALQEGAPSARISDPVAGNFHYYRALSATAEVQKRLLAFA